MPVIDEELIDNRTLDATVVHIDGDRIRLSSNMPSINLDSDDGVLPAAYSNRVTVFHDDPVSFGQPPVSRERRMIASATVNVGARSTTQSGPVSTSSPQPAMTPAVTRRRSEATSIGDPLDATPTESEDARFAARRLEVALEARQQKRRRRFRITMGLLVVVGVGGVIAASPVLRVTSINVVGNEQLSTATVLGSARVTDAPSMLVLATDEVAQRVGAHPLVDRVDVWKSWPNTLNIRISERFAVATRSGTQGWEVIDQHGALLETRTARPPLPTIESKNDPAVLRVAASAPAALRRSIQSIVATEGGLTLVLVPEVFQTGERPTAGLPVEFGQFDDIAAKYRALSTLLLPKNNIDFSDAIGIDLTVADQPVVLRPIVINEPPALADEVADASLAEAVPAEVVPAAVVPPVVP
jgi:hypothetical protein